MFLWKEHDDDDDDDEGNFCVRKDIGKNNNNINE